MKHEDFQPYGTNFIFIYFVRLIFSCQHLERSGTFDTPISTLQKMSVFYVNFSLCTIRTCQFANERSVSYVVASGNLLWL